MVRFLQLVASKTEKGKGNLWILGGKLMQNEFINIHIIGPKPSAGPDYEHTEKHRGFSGGTWQDLSRLQDRRRSSALATDQTGFAKYYLAESFGARVLK
ncbi:hypothetical protein MC885_011660 [Smutsia gigantea]|nr:hypothetical protein MC885_011660 [Smutsia gigantea]